jgi:hypothetical protein
MGFPLLMAHLSRTLIQGGLNAAKDLKGRKLGESIVTNTASSRQLFHVGAVSHPCEHEDRLS